jgi:hypothetical protein
MEGGNMGKIIEFRLPDRAAAGYVEYGAALPKEKEWLYNPRRIIPFPIPNFSENLKKPEDKPPRKEPVLVSALPGVELPPQYPDFRPFLQRDGLILQSWAKWNMWANGLEPCYIVHWITSAPARSPRRYASRFIRNV